MIQTIYSDPNSLSHHGVKGMHWGVRKQEEVSFKDAIRNKNGVLVAGVSKPKMTAAQRSTSREAQKDAEEFARAKMFYGKGAGNRRKLIKASVEAKKKKDPFYAQEFERHLSNQDMDKHAVAARKERKSKDTQENMAKTARGVGHLIAGDGAAVSQGARTAYEILKRFGG